jgi:hypothetical protein
VAGELLPGVAVAAEEEGVGEPPLVTMARRMWARKKEATVLPTPLNARPCPKPLKKAWPRSKVARSHTMTPDPNMAPSLAFRVRKELAKAAREDSLLAMFDAARIRNLAPMLGALHLDFMNLYSGSPAEEMASVAPYIAKLELRDDIEAWFATYPQTLPAALFLTGPVALTDARDHFRRFLQVIDAQKRQVYFRFYDPRVLGPFLSACNEMEKRQFFGRIHLFLACDPDAETASDQPALRQWRAPAEGTEPGQPPVRRPSALSKFTFRPEHEAALRQDAMARYEERVEAYLREQYPSLLGSASRPEVVSYLQQAMTLAPQLSLVGGRDVTLLAEVLVLVKENEISTHLHRFAVPDRPRQLWSFRNRLQTRKGDQS